MANRIRRRQFLWLLTAGAGVAVPPDDAEALTKALARLVADPDEAQRMGAAGRASVERRASPAASRTGCGARAWRSPG